MRGVISNCRVNVTLFGGMKNRSLGVHCELGLKGIWRRTQVLSVRKRNWLIIDGKRSGLD
jgi:hypothetical protein